MARRSLITYDEAANRYSLHDLISAYCVNHLSAFRARRLAKRHAAHFLKVAGEAGFNYNAGYSRFDKGVRPLQLEWPNVDAAFEYAKLKMPGLYAQTVWDCRHYLAATRLPSQRLEWLTAAVARTSVFRRKNRVLHGRLFAQLADVHGDLGQPHEA